MTARLQGRDEIIIDVPPDQIWSLIADSTLLARWGPPVTAVQLVEPAAKPERVGSRRRVDARFNGKDGHFVEVRTEHVEGKRIAYVIEQDTFGLGRVMTEPGFALDIEPAGPGHSRVTFSFFHHPKGVLGHVMNVLVVLRQQRRNRRAALASLKRVAEAGRH
jgi:uncharacterized protein YndB with AHSA1/START domain